MTAESDRIKKLLNDEDFKQAIIRVESAIHNGWASTPPTDMEAQREWHRRLFTLNSVVENLRAALQDGEYEDYIVAENEKPSQLGDIAAWRIQKAQQS